MQPLPGIAGDPFNLYLMLPDGTQLFLSREHINRATERYWLSLDQVPAHIRAAIELPRCEACPQNPGEPICGALRPVLPLLDHLGTFSSFDAVEVVHTDAHGVYHVANTSLQAALAHISMLSFIHYCPAGREYRKYYFGIPPLCPTDEMAGKLFLNIYWQERGDAHRIAGVIERLGETMRAISANQVRRLNCIAAGDVFNNTTVSAHTVASLLSLGIERELEKAVARFETTT